METCTLAPCGISKAVLELLKVPANKASLVVTKPCHGPVGTPLVICTASLPLNDAMCALGLLAETDRRVHWCMLCASWEEGGWPTHGEEKSCLFRAPCSLVSHCRRPACCQSLTQLIEGPCHQSEAAMQTGFQSSIEGERTRPSPQFTTAHSYVCANLPSKFSLTRATVHLPADVRSIYRSGTNCNVARLRQSRPAKQAAFVNSPSACCSQSCACGGMAETDSCVGTADRARLHRVSLTGALTRLPASCSQ